MLELLKNYLKKYERFLGSQKHYVYTLEAHMEDLLNLNSKATSLIRTKRNLEICKAKVILYTSIVTDIKQLISAEEHK